MKVIKRDGRVVDFNREKIAILLRRQTKRLQKRKEQTSKILRI